MSGVGSEKRVLQHITQDAFLGPLGLLLKLTDCC